jgi:hypothetical protein
VSEDPVTIISEQAQPSTGGSSPNPGHNPLPLPSQLGELWLAPKTAPTHLRTRIWMDGPPTPTESGTGGWAVVAEEGEKGTIEYQGVEPDRWTIPVTLDGWAAERDVQPDWEALRKLAQQQGPGKPPPEVWLSGALPPDLLTKTWVIERIIPLTEEKRLIGGERGEQLLRARATINLLEANFPTSIASPIKQAQSNGKGHATRLSKPARSGDTLVKIAARELGDPEKWREISRLNHNRQPDNVHAGERFRLP